jgi:putative ABC transport system permease protein
VQRLVSVGHGGREFQESLSWAEPNLFDVLPLPVLAGDPHTALADPDGVVLTRSLARKYFGRDTPIGETLDIGRQFPLRVSAVLEDLPSNTHLNFGAIASARSTRAPEAARDTGSIDSIGYVYLRLASGASAERLRQELPAFNDRHPEVRARRLPFLIDRIVPIADIHLRTSTVGAMKPAGNADTAYSALAIAILIMVVAGFNFVNLTTARAVRRAIEVGVRKVSGAQRRQLIAQFIGESVFYAVLGMFIAVDFAMLLLPSFNGFLQRTITLDFGKDPSLLVAVFAIVALVGGAAGAYPAFVLSRFSPAAVLKGPLHGRGARGGGRQVLVALQFAVLIVLALGAAAVHRQVRYATTEALRFDKDQMLLVTGACLPPLVAEIRALPGVRDMTCTMGQGLMGGSEGRIEIAGPDGAKARAQMTAVDFGTFGVYGLNPVAGRLFSADFGGDAIPDTIPAGGKFGGPSGVVIDEALSRALGFATPADAVGKTARFTPSFNSNTDHVEVSPEIVGVVQDFESLNRNNLRENIVPRIFFVWPSDLRRAGILNVKLTGDRIPETLAAIDSLWKKLGPPRSIERAFLDQIIDDVYREFTRLGEIMAVFAAIAVFISCLGLFGLAAFAAEQRTKEIGVRKALGASRRDILRLMLWEFSRPVLWGSFIAWPVGYLTVRYWLDGFADRVDIGLWTFPAATALALGIALLTVVGHAFLVARAAPVTALRYE